MPASLQLPLVLPNRPFSRRFGSLVEAAGPHRVVYFHLESIDEWRNYVLDVAAVRALFGFFHNSAAICTTTLIGCRRHND